MNWLFLELSIKITITLDSRKQNRIRGNDGLYRCLLSGLLLKDAQMEYPGFGALAKDSSSIPTIHIE